MSVPALAVEGIRYVYPDGREALRGVDLQIEVGERVAVIGPNGAGKTTLALHLNGILEPARGTVTIGGLLLTAETLPEIRSRVGLVFQDSNDQLFMPTVAEDVAFGPANYGIVGQQLDGLVAETLESVDAADLAGRPPHHLSGGERRRAALATVLAMKPDVLVLDEPASGLDPAGRRDLIRTLGGLDVTHLVITHDLPFALEFCDRVVVMDEGRVVADGRVLEILPDADLLARHRLEMPYGLDPGLLRRSIP